MKRAHQFREYRDAKPFRGARRHRDACDIDPATGHAGHADCPDARPEVFIAGTQPVGVCRLHGGSQVTNVAGWETTAPQRMEQPPVLAPCARTATVAPPASTAARRRSPPFRQPSARSRKSPKEKKGILRRIWGVFK